MTRKDKASVTAEIGPVKGRPMLSWVGKRALSRVNAFPAQLAETYHANGAFDESAERWESWPAQYPKGGLLFYGDNKEVLANLLTSGFRGKVNLVYVDPPFDSGADYVRQVQLRGADGSTKIEGETHSLGEQIQYTDIWANDNYLQFMYERLMLLKELMAEDSMIYLHADSGRSHQLRMLMDEVFGQDAFRNEIVWWYWNKLQGNVNRFASNHDTIVCYRKGSPTFKKVREEREKATRQLKRSWDPVKKSLVNARDEEGNLVYLDSSERTLDDVWRLSMLQPADEKENLRFPTQKPEALLSIIVESSSKPDDVVLDCFIGSGTTAAVAQKLGRRWIGCDINKGAIQTTSKRLQKIIDAQVEIASKPAQNGLDETEEESPAPPAQTSFSVYRVNDYDLAIQHNEAANLACEHIGIDRTKTDSFFDGILGSGSNQELVKIVPFDHPLGVMDLEDVKRELEARGGEETRGILLVCVGKELQVDRWLEEWNKNRGIIKLDETNHPVEFANKVRVIELRTDQQYGKFFVHQPAQADVKVSRADGKIRVEIEDFISPTIVERLGMDAGDNSLFKVKITDWRAMVDSVMIDPDYDGETFNVALHDIPESKQGFVKGTYELSTTDADTAPTVAVKITDMLGEEVLVTRKP